MSKHCLKLSSKTDNLLTAKKHPQTINKYVNKKQIKAYTVNRLKAQSKSADALWLNVSQPSRNNPLVPLQNKILLKEMKHVFYNFKILFIY